MLYQFHFATREIGRQVQNHKAGHVGGAVPIEKEFYLGFVLDRSSQRVIIVASAEGGMEIEEISEQKPDTIVRATVEPAVGLQEFQ